MTWKTPDGVTDPDNAWTNEEKAIDDDTGTSAYTMSAGHWLVFTVSPSIWCDSVRVWTGGTISNLDLEVHYDGAWHSLVDNGAITSGDWIVFPLGGTYNVDQARIMTNNNNIFAVVEFDFNEVEVSKSFPPGLSPGAMKMVIDDGC